MEVGVCIELKWIKIKITGPSQVSGRASHLKMNILAPEKNDNKSWLFERTDLIIITIPNLGVFLSQGIRQRLPKLSSLEATPDGKSTLFWQLNINILHAWETFNTIYFAVDGSGPNLVSTLNWYLNR